MREQGKPCFRYTGTIGLFIVKIRPAYIYYFGEVNLPMLWIQFIL